MKVLLKYINNVIDLNIEQKNIKFINILDNGRKIIYVSPDGKIIVKNIYFECLDNKMKNLNTNTQQ